MIIRSDTRVSLVKEKWEQLNTSKAYCMYMYIWTRSKSTLCVCIYFKQNYDEESFRPHQEVVEIIILDLILLP